MKMQLETSDHHLISHYASGTISVNGIAYQNNILITQKRIVEHWFDTDDLNALTVEHFDALWDTAEGEEKPDIVLLGTGANHVFPSMQMLAEIHAKGISVEVMTTPAACRTYSVLMSEHRLVAAALLQF